MSGARRPEQQFQDRRTPGKALQSPIEIGEFLRRNILQHGAQNFADQHVAVLDAADDEFLALPFRAFELAIQRNGKRNEYDEERRSLEFERRSDPPQSGSTGSGRLTRFPASDSQMLGSFQSR